MTRTDLAESIRNGESSFVDFEHADITPDGLAMVLVGFLNHEGGHVLLGVEGDGSVLGLDRDPEGVEEWATQVGRDRVRPAIIPTWQSVPWDDATVVGVVSIPADAPDRPYKAKRCGSWITGVRAGTRTRDASPEEEESLYRRSGSRRYGARPVVGSALSALDRRRLGDYFGRVSGRGAPGPSDTDSWTSLLRSVGLLARSSAPRLATVDGILLFGLEPKRYLPQSGIRARCFAGTGMDCPVRDDRNLAGALTPLVAVGGSMLELGLVDRALDFVRRNISPVAHFEGGRQTDGWDYPLEVVREVIVNALVHRDYSILGTVVDLLVFSDRLEVRSPGRLPNTVTAEGIRKGMRYARNQMLVNVMRDYGYVDARGMGVRAKVIPGMREHNGTEPDLIEEEHRFIVRLWKDASSG